MQGIGTKWYEAFFAICQGASAADGTCYPSVVWSSHCRVTKVAPECLRKASVAEQMNWDISTKEKALFEMALDKENLSWEELLDESGEFRSSIKENTVKE